MALSWWGKGPVPPAALSSLPHCAAIAAAVLHLRESTGGGREEGRKEGKERRIKAPSSIFITLTTSLMALSVSLRYLVATA